MEIIREKSETGNFYAFHEEEKPSYFMYRPNEGDTEIYEWDQGLSFKVETNEAIYRELIKHAKKKDLLSLFEKKEEGKNPVKGDFDRMKQYAAFLQDLDKELNQYFGEELNVKKNRLRDLDLLNYSEDLYLRRYRDQLSRKEFTQLFNIYSNIKVKYYL